MFSTMTYHHHAMVRTALNKFTFSEHIYSAPALDCLWIGEWFFTFDDFKSHTKTCTSFTTCTLFYSLTFFWPQTSCAFWVIVKMFHFKWIIEPYWIKSTQILQVKSKQCYVLVASKTFFKQDLRDYSRMFTCDYAICYR